MILVKKAGKFELFSVSREALIALIVCKFWIDYYLKLSPVRELGFPRFLTIIKTSVKIDV